jgi:hypothetical protein
VCCQIGLEEAVMVQGVLVLVLVSALLPAAYSPSDKA